jgi:cysteine desulfurase
MRFLLRRFNTQPLLSNLFRQCSIRQRIPVRYMSTTSAMYQEAATIKSKILEEKPDYFGLTEETIKPANRPIYMDIQATTPMDPRVLDAMLPFMTQQYGNPHSRTHQYGWESEAAVNRAREQVAALIGADPKEIIFTSGATESNNMSIKGVAQFYQQRKRHLITTQTVR